MLHVPETPCPDIEQLQLLCCEACSCVSLYTGRKQCGEAKSQSGVTGKVILEWYYRVITGAANAHLQRWRANEHALTHRARPGAAKAHAVLQLFFKRGIRQTTAMQTPSMKTTRHSEHCQYRNELNTAVEVPPASKAQHRGDAQGKFVEPNVNVTTNVALCKRVRIQANHNTAASRVMLCYSSLLCAKDCIGTCGRERGIRMQQPARRPREVKIGSSPAQSTFPGYGYARSCSKVVCKRTPLGQTAWPSGPMGRNLNSSCSNVFPGPTRTLLELLLHTSCLSKELYTHHVFPKT